MGFWDTAKHFTGLGIGNKKFRKGIKNFITGTPEVRENVSTLRPEQEETYQQLQNASQGRGAGGAFGDTADYYRDLLSNDSADYNAFAAPQLRQYNEEIVPGLSEQFAGMGSGGLSSSGFRNAQIQGATDLSERLGAIRANLRHSGAQGLSGIGRDALGNYSQNMVTQQGSPGAVGTVGPALVSGATALIGGPAAAAATGAATNWLKGGGSSNPISQTESNVPSSIPQQSFQSSNFGGSSPYGQTGMKASPTLPNGAGFRAPAYGRM